MFSSALKLVHLFSINPHLGPLQISLGRMVIDIVKFFFIYSLVLFAFACGEFHLTIVTALCNCVVFVAERCDVFRDIITWSTLLESKAAVINSPNKNILTYALVGNTHFHPCIFRVLLNVMTVAAPIAGLGTITYVLELILGTIGFLTMFSPTN